MGRFCRDLGHYLHIVDTLETATAFGLHIHPKITRDEGLHANIEFNPYRAVSVKQLVTAWLPLTLTMNNLNRSMGERDLYPFVLSNAIVRKLEFIHGIIADARSGHLKA